MQSALFSVQVFRLHHWSPILVGSIISDVALAHLQQYGSFCVRDVGPSEFRRQEFAGPCGCSNDVALDIIEMLLKKRGHHLVSFPCSAAF
jgi:hypothetical protein